MRSRQWRSCLGVLLWFLYLLVGFTSAQELVATSNTCQVNQTQVVGYNQVLRIDVKQGSNSFYFNCDIHTTGVLTLPVLGVDSMLISTENGVITNAIPSNKSSYVLAAGKQRFNVELYSELSRQIKVQLTDFSDFHTVSMTHNTVMSLYIGLCLALAMYVGLLGRGIKHSGFFAYSAYLVSLAIFFGIQEGVFNYYSHNFQFLNTRAAQSVFAGIVVLTATLFISRLLDFKVLLNSRLNKSVMIVAFAIFGAGIAMFFTPQNIANLLSMLMGWSTLLLVFCIFCIAGYAAINKVHTANLVVLALSTVLFGMIFRVWLTDLSEFLTRYALVISTAIESFIFAFAASEKVRYLEQEKSKAYHSATQDELCPVMNRRGWMIAVKRQMEYYKARDGVVVLQFIDINEFKSINDNFGHSVGDTVLQTIAKIIRHQAREGDIVGRIGGDEFVVFSYALTEPQAQRICQRLSTKLTNMKLSIQENAIEISASVGAIIVETKDAELSHMLANADQQMYSVKNMAHSKTTLI